MNVTERRLVVVSRELVPGKPIQVAIEVLPIPEIRLSMLMDDFLSALVAEMGSPVALLTQAQLARRVTEAAEAVVTTLKRESAQVM